MTLTHEKTSPALSPIRINHAGNALYDFKKGNSAIMKLIISYRGLKTRPVWQALVETQFKRLEDLGAIASTTVTLELEVPGPDFHAEARDHTLEAAVLKVVKDLERQIRSRNSRRSERWKTNLQLGMTPSRSSSGVTGHTA
jgi:ribosome-associated translation inhibitor RaiA